MNWILFGFRGVGKTYYGKLLSQKLGMNWIDTDDEIVKLIGQGTVKQIHEAVGEETFRAIETQVVKSLAGVTNTVISLGGGAILSIENQEILKKIGQLIYLEGSFDTKLYHERLPIYQSIPARKVENPDILTKLEAIVHGL